ncbi:MAG TPA: gamma-glutamyltransferase family protein [Gemmatimonadaceae bacterium]|nr:gamma-glutamyltransferase family protein [Gemmatimonadaceae bacterium]
MRTSFLLLAMLAAACTAATPGAAPAPSSGPDVGKRAVAEHGMVVSGNPYASEAGLEILKAGGNAVDAAVATAFALGVTEPMMSGLGAGGGLLYFDAATHTTQYVDFYSQSGSIPDTTLRELGTSVTPRGTGIPGAVAGLLAAQARYGVLPRARVMAPAIRLAADGYIANSLLQREVLADSAKVGAYPGARRIYLPDGHPVRAGDRIVQPELAATMRAVAEQGPDAFYKGSIGDDIVRVLREGGNPITRADFAAYSARFKRPLCSVYHGRVVLSAPAPQSGMQVLETLNLLDAHNLPALGLPSRDPAAFRLLVGAMRVAVTDRGAYVGDPDHVGVPQAGVSSPAFAASRAALLEQPVTGRLTAGDPWTDDAALPPAACAPYHPAGPSALPRTAQAGAPGSGMMAETTHMTVVDSHGNAVSLTNTLGQGFGSGTWVDGVFLNSAMFNFSRDHQGPNAAGPHRVPASTIAPTIVLQGGSVQMVVGSPGSAAIPPAIVETIVYGLDYHMDPLAALRMPRAIPGAGRELRMEDGFAGAVYDAARAAGFEISTSPPVDMGFGGVTVIVRRGGAWVGAADPRRDGEVRGY